MHFQTGKIETVSREGEVTMPPDVYKALLEKLKKQQEGITTQEDLELRLWDFAGQELYYVTHQVMIMNVVINVVLERKDKPYIFSSKPFNMV